MIQRKAQRNRFRRIIDGGQSFDGDLKSISDIDWWMLQDLKNLVAYATNSAATYPETRNVATLTYAAYTPGANWSNPAGQIARHAAGAVAPIQQDGIIAAGKTWRYPVVMSNRTAGSISVTGGDVSVSTNGITIVTITAIGADVIITPTNGFDGDLDLAQMPVQQTGILGYEQYPGAELLNTAGAHGTATAANWTVAGSTLTNPSAGILRVARNGVNNPDARQDVLTNGVRTLFAMQTRSDGNAIPQVFANDGKLVWTGVNTHTNWQTVNAEAIPAGANGVFLRAQTSTGTEYTEWRNISVRPANPMNGDNTACAVGQLADGNLGYAYGLDGLASYLDLTSAEFNSILNPLAADGFEELLFVQKDTWDVTERDILSYTVDANNWIRIVDTTTVGTISFQFRAGGTTKEVLLVLGATPPTSWLLLGISVKNNVLSAWYNGQLVGTIAIVTTFVGNFVTMLIGARTTTPTFVHLGQVTRIGAARRELSPIENIDIWQGSGLA